MIAIAYFLSNLKGWKLYFILFYFNCIFLKGLLVYFFYGIRNSKEIVSNENRNKIFPFIEYDRRAIYNDDANEKKRELITAF